MLAGPRAIRANLTAIGLIRDLVQRALELADEASHDDHRPLKAGFPPACPRPPNGDSSATSARSGFASAWADRGRGRVDRGQAKHRRPSMLSGTTDVHDSISRCSAPIYAAVLRADPQQAGAGLQRNQRMPARAPAFLFADTNIASVPHADLVLRVRKLTARPHPRQLTRSALPLPAAVVLVVGASYT